MAQDDPDEWLEGVRLWFYGGTEPTDPEPRTAERPGRGDELAEGPAPVAPITWHPRHGGSAARR